jgi:hypothetical protein
MRQGRLLNLPATKRVTCSAPANQQSSGHPVTRGLVLFLLAVCPFAAATTRRVNAGQSTSMIQRVIRGASPGDTVSFDAGRYNITSGLSLKCAVTYTATTPATPSNVILSASFPAESSDIFTLDPGCTTGMTTISYLAAVNAGLLIVNSPASNLTVTHNQVGGLKCCSSQFFDSALYFNSPGGSENFLTNATVTWNQFGDAKSCIAPQNAMTFTDKVNGYDGGCAGVTIQTSVNGMIFKYNNIFHVGEGVHIVCYGDVCDPPNGPQTINLVAEFNDFSNIHRIAWEEQTEKISGVVVDYNSLHDWYNPYFASFGLSMACCANPESYHPYLEVKSNIIAFNTVPTPKYGVYGYGIEAWGTHATYAHNLVETSNYTWASDGAAAGPGIAWGYGIQYGGTTFSYNTICGPVWHPKGYLQSEGFKDVPPPTTLTGNVTSATCASVPSVAPSISPSSGPQTFPLTVTVSDSGYTSGAQPLGNTGIWYTTDGSTPVPGWGTAQYLADGGKFVLKTPATVKAVGMWGAPNQPTSYSPGYGFVPSAVKSAQYVSGVATQRR